MSIVSNQPLVPASPQARARPRPAAKESSPATLAERQRQVRAHAVETFGSAARARLWLARPTSPLKGRAPAALFGTARGLAAIEALLVRIDHGIAT
jgi:uncharacterized protein (DUF2384 family)